MKTRILIPILASLAIFTAAQAASDKPAAAKRLDASRTALLVTDPQNDFLSPKGLTWGLVGGSVTENRTVEHIEALFKAAKANSFAVFVSPHYYFPTDDQWKFAGTIENVMHDIHMFHREGPLTTEGFEGSGADWLEIYKPYINDGATVIVSPHKVYGPESNDLVLQLRKRRIETIILAGMSANLCVESHLRELLEQGFEIIVVKDATAAAVSPDLGDGYKAAVTNFGFIANEVVTTDEITARMAAARR